MGIGTFASNLLARVDPQFAGRFRDRVVECVVSAPQLAAKFYPHLPEQRSYLVPTSSHAIPVDGDPPIPPRNLWLGYAKTPEQYLANGERRANETREILKTTGFDLKPSARILDFGCASGIMLRWFRDVANSGEAWGVDIAGTPMIWCQQNLSPPFKFATTTSFPYLPFEDRYFDLVYAGSVFTHIADLAEAWLLELKRITRPGGRLFLTVHDNETIKCILEEHATPSLYQPLREFEEETHFQSSGFSMFSINRTPGAGIAGEAQVFYDHDFLLRHWGNYLRVVKTVPRVWGGKLTAFILEK